MSGKAHLVLVLFLTMILICVEVKAEEEMCNIQQEGQGNAHSCGEKLPEDLVIVDESNTKENKDLNVPTGKDPTPSDFENDSCLEKGQDCIDAISTDSNSSANKKSDYYAKKQKSYKRSDSKVEFPSEVKYQEKFLKKGHEHEEYLQSFTKDSNNTDYFDFTIEQDELDYIKTEKLAMYPEKKFQFNNQGNFLHFYKVAYEKEMPVLFTTDSMLSALNENINKIMVNYLENVFIFSLKKFFENLVFHAEQLKENKDLEKYRVIISHTQIYYGTGIDFLSEGFTKYVGPSDVDMYIKGVTALAKKWYTNNFGIMMKARTLNTKYLLPTGLWRRSKRLGNIYITMKWYNLVKFDLRRDINSIFVLGKMIVDSGMTGVYNELREMISYLIGEDRSAPNFAEVYELSIDLFNDPNLYELNDVQIGQLSKVITDKVEGRKDYTQDLKFSADYIFYSQESYDKYRYDKEDTSFLFNKNNNLEEWVLNKMITVTEQGPRLMVSSWEMIDIMHHASSYRPWVFNRFKGKETFKNEQMMPFRDAIDVQENFEKAKYSIKHSMEREPQNWRKNLNNHYHYLLYKLTRRIKHSSDPVYKLPIFKENTFYTSWGAYTHFKRQILLLTMRVSPELSNYETVGIPEIVLEPHLEFYREMENFVKIFKNKIMQNIHSSEYFMKVNYNSVTEPLQETFEDLDKAIQIIIKGIKMQETGKMTEEYKDTLRNLIYFNKNSNTWEGWYRNLYDKEKSEGIFNYDVWISNLGVFYENEKLKFKGASLFNIGKFANMGIIITEDPYEKTKKIMLFSKYNVKEVYAPVEAKPDVDRMSQEIMDRI